LEKKAIHRCLDIVDKSSPTSVVLDLPCGTGRITELLLRRGYSVIAGDVSREMIDVAERRLSGIGRTEPDFREMDIYDLQYDANTFDCVTCIRLFQHLTSKERIKALKELARVSKRYVIVNATYTSTYYGMIRFIRKALGRYAPRYTMSKSEMIEELSIANLNTVSKLYPQPGYNGNMMLLLEKSTECKLSDN